VASAAIWTQEHLDTAGKTFYLTFVDSLTTRLSSKGQVVIPAAVRDALGLSVGEVLTVELGAPGERTIVLRGAALSEIETRIAQGYVWLEQTGDDPVEAFHEARRQARLREHERRGA
jgi:AbrB family looped-hinge helix DNA binding protein